MRYKGNTTPVAASLIIAINVRIKATLASCSAAAMRNNVLIKPELSDGGL